MIQGRDYVVPEDVRKVAVPGDGAQTVYCQEDLAEQLLKIKIEEIPF